MRALTAIELCAGGGGSAVGVELAGFRHVALVELNESACATLRGNRPWWNVLQVDLRRWSARDFRGVDLVAGGVPCIPFSRAGLRRGRKDATDLFPHALRIVEEVLPRAVILENVRGLMDSQFSRYRASIDRRLKSLGYSTEWRLLQAAEYGVPQMRTRTICVALRPTAFERFEWPDPTVELRVSVGEALREQLGSRGWRGVERWAARANSPGPTLAGGSHRKGGPDLGPTRARQEWLRLGVNPRTIAVAAPSPSFRGRPRLTVQMAAAVQGFPSDWVFLGRKTESYRQVANACPPALAEAVARKVALALKAEGMRTGRRAKK